MALIPRRASFRPIRTAVVPVFHGEGDNGALEAALRVAGKVIVVGIVRVESDTALSRGAAGAQEVRSRLKSLVDAHSVAMHAQVYVSASPLRDLEQAVQEIDPDLLLLDWREHPAHLGLSPAELLAARLGPVAILRGRLPPRLTQVLLPIRGGPHAALVLRLGFALKPAKPTVLHLSQTNAPPVEDAPFLGVKRILPQLEGVTARYVVTDKPAQAIVDESRNHDLVILGATARPPHDTTSLGPVADQVLAASERPVLVVRSRAPAVVQVEEGDQWEAALSGGQAISILVDKWFAEHTFDADEFADLERIVASKREQGLTISLALPALNEENTVGKVVRTIQRALVKDVPLLDEIVLIDSDSSDRTRAIAAALGIPVHIHQQMLPRLGARRGKGEALWKSLLATRGDIVAWIDTDIANIHPRFVYGIIGPLIVNPTIQYVKGFYQRPLNVGGVLQEGGGRVTELMARPLLNLFYPELSGVIQPLSGEYAGRRSALEAVRFYSGYGVETGLLIDIFERHGLDGLAQVDLKERIHHNQPLGALSRMSFAILQVVMESLEKRLGVDVLADVNKTMKQIRMDESGYSLVVEEIAERWRPPMVTVPEYHANRAWQSSILGVQSPAPAAR